MTTTLFLLFAATLLGIARFHHYALPIAATGLAAVLTVHLTVGNLDLVVHLEHEWRTLLNLAGLLLGFAILADHFERTHLPSRLTTVLPPGRAGAFLLLVLIALMSSVLDNIAAALIGGAAANKVFRGRVHIGYLAAIVAASNAGGAASVIGDTTTTMLWVNGALALTVAKATVGSAVALVISAFFASKQQHNLQPLVRADGPPVALDVPRVVIVVAMLGGAIGANVAIGFPAAGVWAALLLGALVRPPTWSALRSAAAGTAMLLCLVLIASLMPVDKLPEPTAFTTLGLGFTSAVFDNIPLTQLAIEQGSYDWAQIAYSVGCGGSMLWFGSSAGVAISGNFPAARSALAWLRQGWHVAAGFTLGFLALWLVWGWHPTLLPKHVPMTPGASQSHH